MKFVSKTWGYELWIENNRQYCCKHLHVVPGQSCSIHFHKNKKETFYVISGELLLTYSDRNTSLTSPDCTVNYMQEHKKNETVEFWKSCKKKKIVLRQGESFTLDNYTIHTFTSNTSYACDFIEASTFHEDSDSYRINHVG